MGNRALSVIAHPAAFLHFACSTNLAERKKTPQQIVRTSAAVLNSIRQLLADHIRPSPVAAYFVVLLGAIALSVKNQIVHIDWDAESAEKIDLMGGRASAAAVDGLLMFDLGEIPSALRLPANAECKPAGRLIEMKNSGSVLPGKPFRFELTAPHDEGKSSGEILRHVQHCDIVAKVRIRKNAFRHERHAEPRRHGPQHYRES